MRVRRSVPFSLLRLAFRLPDHPKRNQEGSAQLHGIITTLSRLAHGWEPYLLRADQQWAAVSFRNKSCLRKNYWTGVNTLHGC